MKDLRYRAAEVVAARTIDEKIIFLEFQNGEFFEANGLGARVWALLVEQHTVGEIEQLLGDRYPEARAAIADDVTAFVSELLRRGLIVAQPP